MRPNVRQHVLQAHALTGIQKFMDGTERRGLALTRHMCTLKPLGLSLTRNLSLQFQDPTVVKSSSSEDDILPDASDPNSLVDPATLLFSSVRDVVNLRDFHPPPMQAFMLWQTFLQNVNPLSKVIHAPLVQPQVLEASKDFDSVSKPAVALLFAIYAAAVMSMKEEDCQAQLGGTKTVMLSRFFSAAQQALAAASFLKSRNIVTLQAFVIFLVTRKNTLVLPSQGVVRQPS